jgi:hypothetical protein
MFTPHVHRHGIFLDSCHHHCGAWNGPIIDGKGSGAALNAWYARGSAAHTFTPRIIHTSVHTPHIHRYIQGSAALTNKGFFNQGQQYPCDACCDGAGN